MIHAFWLFHSWNKDKGYMNSLAYEKSREDWCKLNGETHHLTGKRNGMFGKVGIMNPNYGKKLDDDTRKRLSEAQRRSYEDPERHKIQLNAVKKGNETKKFTSKKYFRLRCIETNEVFSSIREAARCLGYNRKIISRVIKNNDSYNGFHFILISKEEYEKNRKV